ncbi:MAG: serine/threonine-protein phosphatase [Acidimicrobiia bacterium]|nr:serine/threonine-protein phosphatase [Acidimicrobiia bacterium]
MTTSVTNDSARILAACDLLAEPVPHLNRESIVRLTAELVARVTASDQGVVALEGPDGTIVHSYPRRIEEVASSALLRRASVSPGWLLDTGDLEDVFGRGLDVRAVAFEAAGRYRGVVAALGPIGGAFGAIDDWLLMVTARRVASQFEVVALHEDHLADQMLANDARLAGEVQQAMLPSSSDAPGLDVAGFARPARQVGGDLFGWYSDSSGTNVTVADVSGKGASAALLMASVQASVRQALAAGITGAASLIDRVRTDTGPVLEQTGRIVTMAAARFHPEPRVTIASAGHSPVIVRSGDGCELILPDSLPLGVPARASVGRTLPFADGDIVVLGTDGLLDQCDPAGRRFGVDRLLTAVAAARGTSNEVAEAIVASVAEFAGGVPQEDDQALVVVTRGSARW